MTSLLNHVIDILFPLALVSLSGAIRIRRSGVAGYDDPYGLTNAFSEMDRPRRADYRTLLRKRVMENDDSYFNPNAGSSLDMDPIDYLRSSNYGDDLDGYLSDYGYKALQSPYEDLEEYPLSYAELERGYGPQKRTAYNPHRVVPTIDELKSIFGEADIPMKRLAPVKRQEPEKVIDESTGDEAGDREKSEKPEEKQTARWRGLITAAEKLSDNNDNTETNQDDIKENIEDETDKDLEDALSDSEVNDDDSNANFEKTDDNNAFENKQLQSKSKRASSVGDSSDYVLGLLKEISYLRNRLDAEEMLRKLQDRENDYLANALKYATMDQIQESDQFVADEYNDIAKATETEELIQKISDGIDEQAIEEEAEEEEEEEEEEEAANNELENLLGPEVKRSDEKSSEDDQWLDNPVEEKVVGLGAMLEDNDEDDNELDGEDFYGSERPIDIPYPDEDSEDVDEEDVEAALANEQTEEENIEGQEFLLAKLISNLSPETLQNVISDLKDREAEALENSVCSPLSELSQNCAFADAKGIPIDKEARNLCIRHQVCYSCGSSLGLSAQKCDDGYKGTVIAECENDVKCVRAAAFFLQLMSTRYHRYEEYSSEQCSNPCVADFIYGV